MIQRLSTLFTILSLALLLAGGCVAITPTAATTIPEPTTDPTTESPHDIAEAAGIDAPNSEGVEAAFDIIHAQVRREGAFLLFQQVVAGQVGSIVPAENGELAGAEVASYVWPTSLDTATVGCEAEQGSLALAVTAHPDFDDTPLVDEDQDGDNGNDGRLWHSHWVVLIEDERCGEAGLTVRDIPEGATPSVPDTWPELPLLIDSPSYDLALVDAEITVRVPYQPFAAGKFFNYDGVTAGLKINADLHAPLLCVTGVHDIASGDLSLPGTVRGE